MGFDRPALGFLAQADVLTAQLRKAHRATVYSRVSASKIARFLGPEGKRSTSLVNPDYQTDTTELLEQVMLGNSVIEPEVRLYARIALRTARGVVDSSESSPKPRGPWSALGSGHQDRRKAASQGRIARQHRACGPHAHATRPAPAGVAQNLPSLRRGGGRIY